MAHPRRDTSKEVSYDMVETIDLVPVVWARLGRVLELAQGHTDEEVSYSDVVCVLLNLALEERTAMQLATLVYKETV